MLEPAKTIIEICGGIQSVAEVTNRSAVRVRRWGYPVDRGGSGGLIPAEVQQVLMRAARERGWPLKPDHFFPLVPAPVTTPDQEDAA
jgi:hypothetical protein